MAASVVVALIAVVVLAQFGGDSYRATSSSPSSTSEQQFQRQQAETQRVKREQVYQDYLAATDMLAEATDAYVFQCPNARNSALEAFNCAGFHSFAPHYTRYEQADAAIRIYWSPTVKHEAEAVASLLPTVDGHFGDGKLHNIDRNRFDDAQKDLRHAVCVDIQIAPHQACE